MGPAYAAFLVRWWRLTDGSDRVVIERVATGERATLGSLPAALAWMDARQPGGQPAAAPGPAADAPRGPGGDRDA
jgi:hypothetical protein